MDLNDLKLGNALPATVFLDRGGRIAARILGEVRRDELKKRLDWLLGEQKGQPPTLSSTTWRLIKSATVAREKLVKGCPPTMGAQPSSCAVQQILGVRSPIWPC
jgi:hypothetical protein